MTIALKAAGICVFEVDLLHQEYVFFENAEDIVGISDEVILEELESYSKLSPDEYQKAISEYFSHSGDWEVISKAFDRISRGISESYEARMRGLLCGGGSQAEADQ